MPPVQLKIEATYIPLTGKHSRYMNKIIKEKVVPIILKEVTVDIADRAEHYARGYDISPQVTTQVQADHVVGESESGYISTGKLADSIQVKPLDKLVSLIEALEKYASYVEFGTWGGVSPGQAPQPFMRGAMWYVKDNINLLIIKLVQF